MNNLFKKKKGFTLIETILVIGIILFILFFFSQVPVLGMIKIIETQNIKDWIVHVNNEVRNYSYNNVTVGQDVINSSLNTNTEVSRFNSARDGTNNNTKLAYYHGIYMTTNKNDNIDPDSNGNFYILQYRQEGYTNFKNKNLETFNVNYNTSPQLLKGNGGISYWVKKIKIPTYRQYYLNKIINNGGNCETDLSVVENLYIIYSTNNLSYQVYPGGILKKDFNYKLCFSQDPTIYEKSNGIEIEFNRDRMSEYYFETLENY